MTSSEMAYWSVYYSDKASETGLEEHKLRAQAYAAAGLGMMHKQMGSNEMALKLFEQALDKLEKCAKVQV